METDCQTVKTRLDAGADLLLLDVREQEEWNAASIEGSTLVPMSEIQDRLSELEPYRDREIVVLCHAGVRSMQVAAWLTHLGFSNVSSLSGGIDAWSMLIDPSVPRY